VLGNALLGVLLAPTSSTTAVASTDDAGARGHQCHGTPDGSQPVYRWVTLVDQRNVVTHAELVYIAAHTDFDQGVSMETTDVVSAEASASASVHASAGVWLAKAETTVSASLKVFGSHTTRKTVDHHFTVHASKHRKRMAFFEGVRFFKLQWHYRNCNARPSPYYRHGRLSSYSAAPAYGNALCPHSRYKRGSMLYTATLAAGC